MRSVKVSAAALAGTYWQGVPAGRQFELRLDPSGGFRLRVFDAVGEVGEYVGRYEPTEDGVAFEHDVDALYAQTHLYLVLLQPLRWGERLYLLDPRRADALYVAATEGIEPRTTRLGGFFLREGDEHKPASPLRTP